MVTLQLSFRGAQFRLLAGGAAVAAVLLLLNSLAGGAAAQQPGRVTGVVVDGQTLRPLAGTQILVAGTQTSAIADAAGRFQITGLEGDEVALEFMRIGYRTVRRTVQVGASNVRITLAETVIDLDEIVVTGTPGGTVRRAIGNSVGTLNAAEVTEIAPVQSVQQLLAGRVPGLLLMQASGNLGSGATTRIRGVSTLSQGNEPIVYVDGVRVNSSTSGGPSVRGGRQISRLNDFSPEEIERIEVIRGPAAATLYGTEASNGVIQIFTKRGTSGQPSFEGSVRYGANWLADPEGKFPTLWSRDAQTGQLISLNLLAEERAAGRKVFTTGPVRSYAMSARGGTDLIRYYVSGGTGREEGMVSYNWQEQRGARANVQIIPSDQLEFSVNLGLARNTTRLAQSYSGWDLAAQLIWGSPRQKDAPVRGYLRAPPEELDAIVAMSEIDRTTFSFQATHRPLSWLTQRLTAGADVGHEQNSRMVPRHPDGDRHFFGGLSLGEKVQETRLVTTTTFDYALTASLNVRPDVNLSTSLGAQHYARQNESVSATGRIFPAPGVETVSGAAVTFGDESFSENKTVGLYVQEQLGWRERVFLTAAVRGDANSAFGENYNAALYPKLSATWVLNEEPFWRWETVNVLRLRAAWGRAGQQPSTFAAVRLFSPSTGPADAATITPQNLGNPDLRPEVGEEIEAGFDASVFDERLTLGFTYYLHNTRDGIVSRGVPPSDGFPGSQFVNVGQLRNSGIELQVTGRPVAMRAFSADLNATLSTNESEVISLGDTPVSTGRQRHVEGYPVGGWFHRIVVSSDIQPDGSATNVMCRGGEDPAAPPVPCAQAPAIYTGRVNPAWQGAVSLSITLLERLRLYAMADYRGGYYVENGDIGAGHVLLRNTRAVNEPNDPILMGYAQLGDWQRAGFMDGGFAKLREVSATYSIPSSLVGRVGASRASFTVAGRNLGILWQATKEIWGVKVIDPEMGDTGFFQTVLPQMTQLVTTLRVSF